MTATALAMPNQFPALSSGSLQSYLDSVQQIPVLNREEEQELFRQFHEHEDVNAARTIVLSHLRYVAYVARSYMGYGLPLEDLIQQGNVGLMKSVKRFNLDHEVRLVTFAVHWIKAEIHEYILKNWKIVKVATTKAQRKLFFNIRKAKERLGWFSAEEVNQVAKDLDVKPAEVREMESRLSQVDTSFDMPVSDDEEHFSASPSLFLSGDEADDPAWVVADEEVTDIQNAGLAAAISNLDERARDIIESRWLQEEKVGLKALSEKYGVSMERIRQIEAKTLEKMQSFIEA